MKIEHLEHMLPQWAEGLDLAVQTGRHTTFNIDEVDEQLDEHLFGSRWLYPSTDLYRRSVGEGLLFLGQGNDERKIPAGQDIIMVPTLFSGEQGSRFASWPEAIGDDFALGRENVTNKLVQNLCRQVVNKINKGTLQILMAAAENNGDPIMVETVDEAFYESMQPGWGLLHGTGIYQWSAQRTMPSLRAEHCAYLERGVGLLCGPPDELGAWRREHHRHGARMCSWSDGREMLYGLSAYVFRAIAILDPSKVKKVCVGVDR